MAVPSYETDLLPIDLAEAATAWAEPTATGWLQGAGSSQNDDNPFQGNYAVSKAFNAVGVGGLMCNYGGGITIPTDGAFTGWFFWGAPGSLELDSNGGIRFMAGSSLADFESWDVGGLPSYATGGWTNYAVNPTVAEDDLVNSPTGTLQYFGAAVYNTNSIFKGEPFFVDGFRYGRCEARIYGGQTDNYATFSGYAAVNDTTTNRWGLIQTISGGYQVKGLVIFGYGSAVDFRDSNKNLIIQKTEKVTSNFNAFEVRQAGSKVYLTGINVTSLSVASKGRWITTDNADVQLTTCVFTDMGTFLFMSNAVVASTTFRRCGQVTQGGGAFTGCTFDRSTASAAILSNNPALITGSAFVSDGTGHAIELTAACAGQTYSLTGCSFTGYAATGTPGSSGNEVIYNNSGGAVTINASGCTGSITYMNGPGATTTVNNTITLTLTGLIDGSDIVILDAGTTTERVNVNENSGTTYAYGYTDSGSNVDIGVFKAGYVPYYVRTYNLPTTNGNLPIAQEVDRYYLE